MLARLACFFGFHRVLTTREGSTKKGVPAQFINGYCYRPGCDFTVRIDTYAAAQAAGR